MTDAPISSAEFHALLDRLYPGTVKAEAEPYEEDDPLAFTPVPSATNRHDGWTPRRQSQFIEALVVMGSVSRAARAVSMSEMAAYKLRRRAGAESFVKAWDMALDMGRDRIYDIAMERALQGYTVVRTTRSGAEVTTSHPHDERMVNAALRTPQAGQRQSHGKFMK